MKRSYCLILMVFLCLGIACMAEAAEAPAKRKWDSLLELTHKFSWYPRPDLQKLLVQKSAEYDQSLEEYRALLLSATTGGRAPTERVRPDEFVTGLPWREYYRLSLAEFCLFLATDRPVHLQNAQAVLAVLAKKAEQPEIEFWNYVFSAHQACLDRDRKAFIGEAYSLWQNVILRFELEARLFPSEGAQAGFVRNLPFLYENLAYLVIHRAILEQEIPDLYPLSTLVLDIQPKMTVESGYKTMVAQVVERMRGPASDNKNLNFAVALLEATAKRYDFEDEKEPARLVPKYNQTSKYYQLAYAWADTAKGKAAILTQHMGFLNYVIRRLGDRQDILASNPFFQNLPAMGSDQLEKVFPLYDQLAAPAVREEGWQAEGFEDRKTYLQVMHQLWDSAAKLAIVLSDYYKASRGPEHAAEIYAAARPLELYCNLFDRYARENNEIIPDDAYFLTAFAARELGELYREQARFSTDNRADELAFAYQMQAAEIFPLDLPGILQMAFHCSRNGQVQKYFQYAGPLAARLRVSSGAAAWTASNRSDFEGMVTLVPTVVPQVVGNAFVLIEHFPEEETSEDVLFARAVVMATVLDAGREGWTPEQTEERLTEIGRGNLSGEAATYPFYQLKSELYGAPDSPLHGFLRTLYHEVPYENHAYVSLRQQQR